jgi:hypothetical protein
VWRELERDEASLAAPERSRYAYLRGMTDYRLGFRDDARHWLALAKAAEQYHPGGLDPAFRQRLDDALNDLAREVGGVSPSGADAVQSIEAQPVEVQPTDPPPANPLVPGTQVPGTQVPGTQVPGTQAPGTQAPDTRVPPTQTIETPVPALPP